MDVMNHSRVHHSERSPKIDALRGIAVLGMIIAHGLFFFHNRSNPHLTSLETLLNSTVFTIFVFVFGQSLSKWLDVHAFDHPRTVWAFTAKRAGLIYLLYMVVSSIAIGTSGGNLSALGGALTMTNPPNFTEYMPLFVILVLATPALRPLLRLTRSSMLLTFIIGAFSYLVGITLHQFSVPDILVGLKALLSGSETLLRFPVLFYFPVVLWGLWWQHDSDHNTKNKSHTAVHVWIVLICTTLSIAGIAITQVRSIPLLDPNTRWPPSIPFLAFGMSTSAICLFLMPSLAWIGGGAKRVIGYFGRDALDLWATHLILLFLYRRFVSWSTGNAAISLALTCVLLILTVLFSSIMITNKIRFPFHVALTGTTRFRKRYIVYSCIALLLLIWSTTLAPGNPYGNFMVAPSLTAQSKLPPGTQAQLTTNAIWYVRHHPTPQSLEITVSVDAPQPIVSVHPDSVQIKINGVVTKFSSIAATNGALRFTKQIADILPGMYSITAVIAHGDASVSTNAVTVTVSEPLLVAWTFDWEGWDVSDEALRQISQLADTYPTVKFSHFVNPRTFLPGVISPIRASQILAFLSDRHGKGDEIAMHLHMHHDLVLGSGVSTRSAHPWGLRTAEGYDTPTTEYTPAEFRQIVRYAQRIASESGLPPMEGYRAGGWFLNTLQLNELQSLGYTYDSSGRDRPTTGAFRTVPWNLSIGAQPYYPSASDQNLSIPNSGGILEIPTNGLSTYDQTVEMLITRITSVYKGGVLTSPKALVFVSHPQFYTREFPKIAEVLTKIMAASQVAGMGPAVFVTTADIAKLWNTLHE